MGDFVMGDFVTGDFVMGDFGMGDFDPIPLLVPADLATILPI